MCQDKGANILQLLSPGRDAHSALHCLQFLTNHRINQTGFSD